MQPSSSQSSSSISAQSFSSSQLSASAHSSSSSCLPSADENFLTAVRQVGSSGNISKIKTMLADQKAPVDVNYASTRDGSTALHIAVVNSHAPLVHLLLNSGAKTCIPNREFQTPLQTGRSVYRVLEAKAVDSRPENAPVMMQLLERRTPITREELNHVIDFCLAHYRQNERGHANEDRALLDYAASRLACVNVDNNLRGENTWKYYAHLTSIKGNKVDLDQKDTHKLEGWYQDIFLSLRIRTFLEIVVKLIAGTIPINTLPLLNAHFTVNQNREALTDLLCKELLTELESLQVLQDIDLLRIGAIDINHKPLICNAIAKNIASRIEQLPDGEEFCFASGWLGHAIYVSFVRLGSRVAIRVDNLGDGLSETFPANHHLYPGERLHQLDRSRLDNRNAIKLHRYFPRVLGSVPLTEFKPNKSGVAYLEALIGARGHGKPSSEGVKICYDFDNRLANLQAENSLKNPSAKLQSAGNCSVKNHEVGLQIRLGLSGAYDKTNAADYAVRRKEVYRWLRREEHNLVYPKLPPKPSDYKTYYSPYWDLYRTSNRLLPQQVQEVLTDYYHEHTHIVGLFDTRRQPIADMFIELAIVKENLNRDEKASETKAGPSVTSLQNRESTLEAFERTYKLKEAIRVENLFRQAAANKILISGAAGVGKSTFCQYAAVQSVNNKLWQEQFDAVIWLKLRNLTAERYPSGQNYSFLDIVKKEFSKPFAEWTIQNKVLQDQLKNRKLLWLLDGYDELPNPLPEQLQAAVENLFHMQHVIVTSRPGRKIQYWQDIDHQELEAIGFTNQDIKTYISHFFAKPTGNTDTKDALNQEQKLLQILQANASLWGMAHIPINLELICAIWQIRNFTATTTITELYHQIVTALLQRCITKLSAQSAKEDKDNSLNMSEQKLANTFSEELRFLERLAFQGIRDGKVVFNSDVWNNLLRASNVHPSKLREFEEKVLKIGVVQRSKAMRVGGIFIQDSSFIHPTMQEFFAAGHLVSCLYGARNSDYYQACQFIRAQQHNSYFRVLLSFTAGLLSLDKTAQAQQALDIFWHAIKTNDNNLMSSKHFELLMHCLNEANSDGRIPVIRELSEQVKTHFDRLGGIVSEKKYWNFARQLADVMLGRYHFLGNMQALIISPRAKAAVFDSNAALIEQEYKGTSNSSEVIPAWCFDKHKRAFYANKEKAKFSSNEEGRAIEALVKSLEDEYAITRIFAAGKLISLDPSNERLVPALLEILDCNSGGYIKKGFWSYFTNGYDNKLYQGSRDGYCAKVAAIKMLIELGNSKPTIILKLLDMVREYQELDKAVVWEIVQNLLTDLTISDDPVISSLTTLLEVGSKNTESYLSSLLAQLVRILGKIGAHSTEVASCLKDVLMKSKNFEVKSYAAVALVNFGVSSSEIIDALVYSVVTFADENRCYALQKESQEALGKCILRNSYGAEAFVRIMDKADVVDLLMNMPVGTLIDHYFRDKQLCWLTLMGACTLLQEISISISGSKIICQHATAVTEINIADQSMYALRNLIESFNYQSDVYGLPFTFSAVNFPEDRRCLAIAEKTGIESSFILSLMVAYLSEAESINYGAYQNDLLRSYTSGIENCTKFPKELVLTIASYLVDMKVEPYQFQAAQASRYQEAKQVVRNQRGNQSMPSTASSLSSSMAVVLSRPTPPRIVTQQRPALAP